MAVIQGGSYGPWDSFPDGTVFIGCTFYSSCTFGDGCVFIDCNLVKKKKTPHSVGNGASMSGGFVENTVFGDGGTEQEGEAITRQGPPMQGSIMLEKGWCKSWTCRAPYIDANIIGTVNAPVKVTYAGTEYSFPASG